MFAVNFRADAGSSWFRFVGFVWNLVFTWDVGRDCQTHCSKGLFFWSKKFHLINFNSSPKKHQMDKRTHENILIIVSFEPYWWGCCRSLYNLFVVSSPLSLSFVVCAYNFFIISCLCCISTPGVVTYLNLLTLLLILIYSMELTALHERFRIATNGFSFNNKKCKPEPIIAWFIK